MTERIQETEPMTDTTGVTAAAILDRQRQAIEMRRKSLANTANELYTMARPLPLRTLNI